MYIPLLALQGSGGTAGVPGDRGRTGPLGRKVCLEDSSSCLGMEACAELDAATCLLPVSPASLHDPCASVITSTDTLPRLSPLNVTVSGGGHL